MSNPFSISIKDGFQGSPIPLTINIWSTAPDPDAQPPVVGVPKDISGWQFFFTWKMDVADADSEALYAHDWLVTAGTGGSTSVTIPSAKTLPVPAKTMTFWDLKAIQVTGDPGCVLNGTIFLNPAITQRLVPTYG